MIKIHNTDDSKYWTVFEGTFDQAVKKSVKDLEAMDWIDCDRCWDHLIEVYDTETRKYRIIHAYFSGGWVDGEKEYPAEVEIFNSVEAFLKVHSSPYGKKPTKLDPCKDYILV